MTKTEILLYDEAQLWNYFKSCMASFMKPVCAVVEYRIMFKFKLIDYEDYCNRTVVEEINKL